MRARVLRNLCAATLLGSQITAPFIQGLASLRQWQGGSGGLALHSFPTTAPLGLIYDLTMSYIRQWVSAKQAGEFNEGQIN